MSVRLSTIGYLIETTCIYICALLCLYHVKFQVLIIMPVSVKRHYLWCTARDMRFGKYSIIIIIVIYMLYEYIHHMYIHLDITENWTIKILKFFQQLSKSCKKVKCLKDNVLKNKMKILQFPLIM